MSQATIVPTRASRRPFKTWLLRKAMRRVLLVGGLTIFTIWTLFPFVWIIQTSLKPNVDIYRNASLIPQSLTTVHYVEIFSGTRFLTYFRNSMIVGLSTMVIAMAIAILSAYAMTRLSFRGRAFMARCTIITYLVPAALLFVPLLQIANQFHLTNKASGLIIIYLLFTVPFSTWLTISYFNTIPSELEDAALVDGANRFQSLIQIFVPLSLPALAVVALFTFTLAWNEFLFALLLIARDSQKTLPLGLAEFIIGDTFAWGPLMAGAVLASVPPVLVYILAQRWVVSGLAGGALKG